MLGEGLPGDMRGAGEGGVAIAIGLAELDQNIALPPVADQRRVRARRLAAAGDGRQDFVLDLDRRGGVLRQIAVFGDHRGDRLADMAHLVAGKNEGGRVFRNLVGLEPQRHPRLGDMGTEIGAGIDRMHPLQPRRGGTIDALDPGMRVGAADEGRVQHAGDADVVDELPASAQQRRVLDPADPLSDDTQGFRRFSDGRRGAGTALRRHSPWFRACRGRA